MIFAAPWLLLGLAGLPLVWWWTRSSAAQELRQSFPPLALLHHLLVQDRDPPQRRPWWLVALRLTLAATLIVWAAHPILPPAQDRLPPSFPLLLVLDDGWAAASDWQARLRLAEQALHQAERQGQSVSLLTTAADWDGTPPRLLGGQSPADLRQFLRRLTPKPWPGDRRLASQSLTTRTVTRSLWISDGVEDGGSAALLAALTRLGGGIQIAQGRSAPHLTAQPQPDGGIRITLSPADATAQAVDDQGMVVGSAQSGQSLALPQAVLNRLSRLQVAGDQSAGGVFLLDGGWRRVQVGLIAKGSNTAPLLSDSHYIRQAMNGFAQVNDGPLADLLPQSPAVLVASDQIFSTDQDDTRQLERWIQQGGVLIRFAGPRLAQQGGHTDPLLPLRLRGGDRILGGSLSWSQPLTIQQLDGPLADLPIPPDVTISRQILADPVSEGDGRIWATLNDHTPLVSAAARGRGWIILIHTAATPAWSTLPLSGLYVDMLHRLAQLSQGGDGGADGPPHHLLDGLGHLFPTPDPAPPAKVGGIRPPGQYGGRAVNLGPQVAVPQPIAYPRGQSILPLDGQGGERDMRPWLTGLAGLLFLADCLLAMGKRRPALILAVLSVLAVCPAQADQGIRLGVLSTGVGPQPALAGLDRLGRTVQARSTILMDAPVVLSPDRDDLLFHPLIYWPISAAMPPLSAAGVMRLNAYMRGGGLLVIDAADDAALDALLRLAPGLESPPLSPLTSRHDVSRAFYLLRDAPGQVGDGGSWIAEPPLDGDGVAPLLITRNGWAAAWADNRQANDPTLRLGVNLVIYALTGTYKADQVHLPAIMERLGR